jgi:ABC-type dipeptide/oligopeptide/nickel transport system permease subunit
VALAVSLWAWGIYDLKVRASRPRRRYGDSQWTIAARQFRKNRMAMAGLLVMLILYIITLLTPLISPYDPIAQGDIVMTRYLSPSWAHLMGTDKFGRDILSRVLYGARISLEVAFISTGLAVFFGVLLGTLAGFLGGWLDTLVSRTMDVFLAFPILLLAIGLSSACTLGNGCLGGLITPGRTTLIIVIALASWPYIGRIIRGQVLSLREKEFVDAARSLGASNSRIMRREVLPNLVAPIIVYSSLILPTNVLYEAALSFLGVGVQPPTASWGQMIATAAPIFDSAWWYMLFPGIALVLTVLAFNLVGDGLQDALDPRGTK